MKKYYFGVLIIAILTLGLLVFTIAQGASQKQDKETEKKAREIAESLNSYISQNRRIPETLKDVGINDAPATIKFTKESDTTYTFCETYKNESSYSDTSAWGLLAGTALRSYDDSSFYDYDSDYTKGSLYPNYSHKKGENCQTIEPYSLSSKLTDYYSNNSRSTSSTSGTTARNTERQTDIKAMHGQVEAYYAQNGYYPTLNDMNSSSFRSSNLKGLDNEALKDPSGVMNTLSSSPAKNVYSYDVQKAGGGPCDNVVSDCAQYTLTATYEGGGTYTKLNLN